MCDHVILGDVRSVYRASMASRNARKRPVPTRELIADRTLAFIDEHGLDALTLTALGKDMNCHGAAIHRHSRDKDELVEATLGRMYVVADVRIPSRGSARQRLIGLMRSLRHACAEHPNFALRNLTWHEERETAEVVPGTPTLTAPTATPTRSPESTRPRSSSGSVPCSTHASAWKRRAPAGSPGNLWVEVLASASTCQCH